MRTVRRFQPRVEQLEQRFLLASLGTLLQYDFNGATVWPLTPGIVSPGVIATQNQGAVGTIDIAGGTTNSGGVSMAVSAAPSSGFWKSELSSGQLAVTNTITNLGLLTLSFDLRASVAKPVKVLVDSYNASDVKTGTLETMIYPAAANTYQRFAIDLSTMQSSGTGTFSPTAPKVAFRFEVSSQAGWSAADLPQLRLDNVNLAKPAYYVRPAADGGNNSANGRSETTAFATPQQAVNVSQPGDIIVLMNGTYLQRSFDAGAISITKGGTPAAWLSIKNYPGQSPLIYNEAWNAVNIGGSGTKSNPATTPSVAYVEIRGLRIQGNALYGLPQYNGDPVYGAKYAAIQAAIDQVSPITNNNGITVGGYYDTNLPHHIRIADNIVEYTSGGGIGVLEGDSVMIENNITRFTSWWTQYGTSGVSILSAVNFDGTTNEYRRIVQNNVSYGNETFELCIATNSYSDGNGIIIDVNHNTANKPNSVTVGRTLVQGNLVYNNGGSGIHAFKADHVDIVNNTAYLNSRSPLIQYGQIFAGSANDVKITNNILVATVAPAGKPSEPINGGLAPSGTNGIEYKNNIFWGGNITAYSSTINNNRVADPKFINGSIDPVIADFRLQATSPAINAGLTGLPVSSTDALRNVRNGNPDIGAFEFYATATPTVVVGASATPSLISTTSTTLMVIAGDNNGPAGLTYTWSTTSKPTGAVDPTFDRNSSNAARTALATFSRAGDYTLRVIVSDGTSFTTSSVNVTVNPDQMPLLKVTPATFSSSEGSTVSYSLVLNTRPASDVTVTLSGDSTQATLSASSFTFTPSNWNISQTVNVLLKDDYIVEGQQTLVIGHSVASSDLTYNQVNSPTMTITFTDGSTPAITSSSTTIMENSVVGSTVGTLSVANSAVGQSFQFQTVAGVGSTDNASFTTVGNELRTTEVFDFETKSSYSIRLRATDTQGASFETQLTIQVGDAKEVVSNTISMGGSVQRSTVKNMSFEFDGAVTLQAGAFEVVRRGVGGGNVDLTVATRLGTAGQTIVDLTFSGSMTRGGSLTPGGSLIDGNYELRVHGAKITGWSGGDYVFGTKEADKFYAYYGDTDGDRTVGLAEFAQFRSTFGKRSTDAGYNPSFDYEGIVQGAGAVGLSDFAQFRARYSKRFDFQ